jgi:hypothetical protein
VILTGNLALCLQSSKSRLFLVSGAHLASIFPLGHCTYLANKTTVRRSKSMGCYHAFLVAVETGLLPGLGARYGQQELAPGLLSSKTEVFTARTTLATRVSPASALPRYLGSEPSPGPSRFSMLSPLDGGQFCSLAIEARWQARRVVSPRAAFLASVSDGPHLT